MVISLKWIKDYLESENIMDISSEEIIHKLTVCGLEVEDVEYLGKQFDNIVVGYIAEKKKHPNADKLSLCVVFDGTENHNVVCGAPNVEAGQKIAFAKIGAVIPNGNFKITKAKIRGESSSGMICSEKELGISDDHSGIIVLDPSLKEGTLLADALNMNDIILTIGITPNRPDALCHIGVARDIAAIFNLKFKIPEIKISESAEKSESAASIEILNPEGCPRYSARVIKNVTIKESPAWLKQKLTAIGLRPINNVVDITNFICHETGQPLHAFDLDRLSGQKIIVKNADEGENFTTLDSKQRKMLSTDLMICDGEKPVAIAGVMGGENSEVSTQSKNLLIESAYFNPAYVRKTAKRLQLSTDASYRMERGIDPNNTLYAANRAAQLISELAGGEILAGALDVYPNKINPIEVKLRFSRQTKILGFEISETETIDILNKLGMKIVEHNSKENYVLVKVPTYRPDIEREIDLIEETSRIYGYDRIPAVEKINITLDEKKDESAFIDLCRNTAIALGFHEIISISLQTNEIASITGSPIPLLNPESADMAVLRTSLLQGGLQAVSKNINVGERDLMLFEIGNVMNKTSGGEIKSFDDFSEITKISFILTGSALQKGWNSAERKFDLYDLKGFINAFLNKIFLDNKLSDSYYQDGNYVIEYGFSKVTGDPASQEAAQPSGTGGLVRKDVLKIFDISQEVFYFEFDINRLSLLKPRERMYQELLKFPRVVRDCAFIVDRNIKNSDVLSVVKQGKSKLLRHTELFDVFENESLGAGKKSMAYSFEFYDENKTLKDEEVDKEISSIINRVVKELNAEFRGTN